MKKKMRVKAGGGNYVPVHQQVTFVKRPESPKIVDLSGWKRPLNSGHLTDRRLRVTAEIIKSRERLLRLLSIPALMAFQPARSSLLMAHPREVYEEPVRYADHNFEAEVPALYQEGAEFTPVGFKMRLHLKKLNF